MGSGLLVILLVVGVASFITAVLVLGLPGKLGLGGSSRSNIRTIVSSQRNQRSDLKPASERSQPDLLRSAQESKVIKKTDSRLTLKKRLKYAQWPLPVVAFRLFELGVSIIVFSIVALKMNYFMQGISLLAGPLFMRWLLNTAVERRFKRFDGDYPQFLLSLVGLLKTGMTAMGALEAAAEGLDENSLVKEEVRLMIERMRFGVPEDKSIGAFGEDIFHQEIELFVQALLLSRRVGGNLSDTLDRLAKQVRKRQFFRASAVAAVSMQRGSIWVIIALLVGLEVYLYTVYPELVVEGIKSEMGWQVWQGGIAVMLLGIFWVRQVTKIRI